MDDCVASSEGWGYWDKAGAHTHLYPSLTSSLFDFLLHVPAFTLFHMRSASVQLLTFVFKLNHFNYNLLLLLNLKLSYFLPN